MSGKTVTPRRGDRTPTVVDKVVGCTIKLPVEVTVSMTVLIVGRPRTVVVVTSIVVKLTEEEPRDVICTISVDGSGGRLTVIIDTVVTTEGGSTVKMLVS